MTAANGVIRRPITVRVYDKDTFHPLAVNQLLLGRTTTIYGQQGTCPFGQSLSGFTEWKQELLEVHRNSKNLKQCETQLVNSVPGNVCECVSEFESVYMIIVLNNQ